MAQAEINQEFEREGDPVPAQKNGSVWCVLLAGGSGQRFGSLKQFDSLAGVRVIDRAARTAAAACDGVIAVLPADSLATADGQVPDATVVVAGGSTRSESVRAGLAAIPAEATVILVHDAARPLATADLFAQVIAQVQSGVTAVVPAVQVVDTIRVVTTDSAGSETAGSETAGSDSAVIDRDLLRAVQTPQGFQAALLRRAYDSDGEATDDAGLVQALGARITLIAGERSNLKLTERADRIIAAALLESIDPDSQLD
jgi:2-C-methyl-D-erythritol 4-phosphate cytidylyltransferase